MMCMHDSCAVALVHALDVKVETTGADPFEEAVKKHDPWTMEILQKTFRAYRHLSAVDRVAKLCCWCQDLLPAHVHAAEHPVPA